MYGHYFYYNNHTSQEFHLMMGGFDYTEDVQLGLSRSVYKGSFSTVRKIPNFMGTEYVDTLSFRVSCVKDPCEFPAQEDAIFTEDEVDAITSWLTEPNYPTLFHMYDYDPDVYRKYDYFAVVTEIEPQVFGGDVWGFDITFETNAPYAWSELIVREYQNSGTTTKTFTVNNSERQGLIFPTIKILPDVSGAGSGRVAIAIKNLRDNRTVSMNVLRELITMDCQHGMFYSQTGLFTFEDLGISDVDSIYWPRLYNGQNRFQLTGNATFTFEYREPRKVGAY